MILQLEEAKTALEGLVAEIAELGAVIGVDALRHEHAALEARSHAEGFWDDVAAANGILKTMKQLSSRLEEYDGLAGDAGAALELAEFALESGDEGMSGEIAHEAAKLRQAFDKLNLKTLLTGEYDASSAVISIHPGAGGTEAQDWAQMLWRMYTRWAERSGYKVKLLDYLEGEGAGIKAVTFSVEGENAYGYLRGENGVHRLVRISPFDSSGRRHTSFASVEAMPELSDEVSVEIKDEDIRIETHRSSGAGGQHVNKTDSAVRIIHIPTGITVGCQSERSQMQNRETAMRVLKGKLVEIKEREQLERIEDIKGNKANIEWGSQIRSYVFMPYTLVKDNRTNFENGNVNAVMDGEIDGVIQAYLKKRPS